ncbi:hypothetical protein [Streptomyces ambofaciens]|uniref:Uncharacterized protein n=1 Tax=Streptomyces ambofaciens TaxID=1889 RepID=Q0JWF1_STRAM|nr:hypothetical protein [Streptomyces ambofaciens]CAK50977.1 hypothetical protein DSMT0134 [Streptomyces ambofaciens]CAK51215.1 hypothetical protein DSMT0134 [Streptomyces ambofaciens]
MESGINKAAAWLGVVTGTIAILAFFGVNNFEELQRAVADSARSDDALSDPCEALPADYLSNLRVSGPKHAGDEFRLDWPKPKSGNPYHWWNCGWLGPNPKVGEGNLVIGYSQNTDPSTQGMRPMNGIPDATYGTQNPGYDSSCFVEWPIAGGKGQASVWYGGTCSDARAIARKAYEKLSR